MKKNEYDDPHSVTKGIIVIVIVMLLAIGGVTYWMYSVNLIAIPEFITVLFGAGSGENSESVPWDVNEVNLALKNARETVSYDVTFEASYENLKKAILSEPEADGFYRSAKISYYSGGEAAVSSVRLWKCGNKFRVERYNGESMTRPHFVIICDGKNVLFKDIANGEEAIQSAGSASIAEYEAWVTPVSDIISAIGEFSEQENSRISDCRIELMQLDSGNVYYVSYYDNTLGLTEEYLLSLDNMTVISHNTFMSDSLIYSCENVGFSSNESVYNVDEYYEIR